MAVAGCPEPRVDHAVAMTKFASDCMTKFNALIEDLVPTLGENTRELGMRAGLHSGPVTGGVVRGQRSRFQLFGDTVNTSARMESNCLPGKIQASQATADELTSQGHSGWLVAREDSVHAKGKGKMQTYWVNPRSRA